MTKHLTLATALVALMLSGAVQAQDTDPAAEAPAAEAPATDAPAAEAPAADAPATATAPGLDTGQPVGNADEDDTYVKSTEGDWDVQCLRVEQGEEPCQMYQLLQDGNGNSVAEVSIFKVEGAGQVAAGATFIVPLGTLLTEKLTIQVDSAQAKRYDLSFCVQIGCYARVGFTEAEVNAFRRGQVARVTITPFQAPDQRVTVNMSLAGFTAAYDQITALEQ